MCIVLRGQDGTIEQARRTLEDLVRRPPPLRTLVAPACGPLADAFCCFSVSLRQVPVWAVLDYTNTNVIQRELLLVKLSTLGCVCRAPAAAPLRRPKG